MGDFRSWVSKMFLNMDQGNIREALYCSDMALYAVESLNDDPASEELAKVYLCRGKVLDLMGKKKEANSCYRVVKDIGS